MNSQCLKLNRAHSISFNSSNVGNFFFEFNPIYLKDCIKVQEKKSKVVVSCSRPQQNVKLLQAVSRGSRATMADKCTKSVHVQSCCFANLNLLRYCRSRCGRCRHCLSSITVRKCVEFYNWFRLDLIIYHLHNMCREEPCVKVARLDFFGGIPPKFEH